MSKRFYITTAIDYVNGQPHLGHAYEKIITDVIARAHRALGEEVFFLTGLDEHGQKVQQTATGMGKSPQVYCDELAGDWQKFVVKLGLSNNEFIRTTQPRHKEWVQAVLSRLHEKGEFYRQEYRGFYSVKEETFLTDKDRREDGTFDTAWGEVIELSEENYYFQLGRHQQWLIDYIEANPEFVAPDYRRNEVLGFLKNHTLEDLCITRPAARLSWGIPLPFDPAYVTYVWFDALSNYASLPGALGDPCVVKTLGLPQAPNGPELWPADIHVVGKDIIKFHTVYWPIMLKAMGLPLPKQVLVHGWWQKNGAKISKSTGNIVEPVAVIDEWGLDAFRYYVVRELAIGPDGNWTDAGFSSRYHAELANGLGNLLNRSLSMIKKYRQSVVPGAQPEMVIATSSDAVVEKVIGLLRQNELQAALMAIWSLVTLANQYIDQTAPFKLAKDPTKAHQLDKVLYTLVEVGRVLGILLSPFLPGTAEKIFAQLNLGAVPARLSEAAWGKLAAGHHVGDPVPLFPRKDQPAK